MVLYKREFRLWQQMRPTQRALMIRNDADTWLLAIQMQHERMAAYQAPTEPEQLVNRIRQRNDVDFFFMALHRLVITAELAEQLSDPRGVMPSARTAFNDRTDGMMLGETDDPATLTTIRNALEHFQNLETRGGLGFGTGGDHFYIHYRDRMFDAEELMDAAIDLHRAIRAAVDAEAFMDFRGDYPIIELRDPANVVRHWRPGMDIGRRAAAAIADMSKQESDDP